MPYNGITEEQFCSVIPIGEIQKYEGNCWATTLSMMLRYHGFNFTQKYVTDLFYEWRFEGVTAEQMSQLVKYFNNNFLSKKGWVMKTSVGWEGILNFLDQFAPVQVFITGHFVIVLGYDDDGDRVTYFDPWDGSIKTVSKVVFKTYGGRETVFMHKE